QPRCLDRKCLRKRVRNPHPLQLQFSAFRQNLTPPASGASATAGTHAPPTTPPIAYDLNATAASTPADFPGFPDSRRIAGDSRTIV
ncbi:MAG: hypothetical protein ACK5AN_12905, partial [Planctomyces sp.]